MIKFQSCFKNPKIVIPVLAVIFALGAIAAVEYQNQKSEERMIPPIPTQKAVSPEEVGAGKIGETKETLEGEEIVILPAELGGPPRVLPPAIFNESGQIKEIKKDSLIVEGTGYNFADQKPRYLTLKFIVETRTNLADGSKFRTGPEGLTRLKVGDSITFESPENIRGKTEFEISYINKL